MRGILSKIKFMAVLLMAAIAGVMMSAPVGAKAASVSLLGGEKQYYTVMMRADKQSLVYAKVTFENMSATEELKSFSFKLPDNVAVSNLTTQQILAKTSTKTCKTYETYNEYKARVSYSYEQSQYYYDLNKKCVTYDENSGYNIDYDFDNNMSSTTAYYDYGYYVGRMTDSTFEYKDVTPKQSGQTYTIDLPNAIQPKKQGAVLIAYTSKSYITGGLGRLHYDFKSFTSDQLVNKAVVAINFDDELYSRLTATTREVSTAATSSIAQGSGLDSASGYTSKNVDNIQTTVGQGGRYVKQKLQLLPGETFSVKGVFSTSKVMLYMPTIVRGVLITVLILAALWFGYRLYRVKAAKRVKAQPVPEQPTAAEVFVQHDARGVPTQQAKLGTAKVLMISAASIGTSVLFILALFGLAAASRTDVFSGAVMSVAMMLAGLLIIVMLFVVPFVYVQLRYGLAGAFRWLLYHVGVLVIMVLLACSLYAIFADVPTYPLMSTLEEGITTQ